MNIALWAAQVLLAVAYGLAGMMKTFQAYGRFVVVPL